MNGYYSTQILYASIILFSFLLLLLCPVVRVEHGICFHPCHCFYSRLVSIPFLTCSIHSLPMLGFNL
jgi:hypothetical protein